MHNRWIVKDPYLTDLELLANSPDCNEACEDSASIISTFPPFPDLDLTPTQMCQATIQNLVGSGMTGRQACDTRLNAISNQTFFLADFLTVCPPPKTRLPRAQHAAPSALERQRSQVPPHTARATTGRELV